jgi:hypothetical protein
LQSNDEDVEQQIMQLEGMQLTATETLNQVVTNDVIKQKKSKRKNEYLD